MRWTGRVARIGDSRDVYRVLVRNAEEREHCEDVHANGSIILKCILKINMGHCGLDLCGSNESPVAECCVPVSSTTREGSPDWLRQPQIQFQRDATLYRSVSRSVYFFGRTFEMSGVIPPTTQCHIPEVLNLQHHRCESLKCDSQVAQDRLLLWGQTPSFQTPTAYLVNPKSDVHINRHRYCYMFRLSPSAIVRSGTGSQNEIREEACPYKQWCKAVKQ